jgi:hypothetical protein
VGRVDHVCANAFDLGVRAMSAKWPRTPWRQRGSNKFLDFRDWATDDPEIDGWVSRIDVAFEQPDLSDEGRRVIIAIADRLKACGWRRGCTFRWPDGTVHPTTDRGGFGERIRVPFGSALCALCAHDRKMFQDFLQLESDARERTQSIL